MTYFAMLRLRCLSLEFAFGRQAGLQESWSLTSTASTDAMMRRGYCGAGAMCYTQSLVGAGGCCFALGLCEVADKDSGVDAIAVRDENAVALR